MSKTLIIGSILAATLITAFAIFASSDSNILCDRKPVNMRKCEENKVYDLEYKNLEVDHELVPGQASKMTAEYLLTKDVNSDKMVLRCYLKGVKVWSTEKLIPEDLKKDTTWFTDLTLTLPRLIPHVFVTMKMFIYGGKDNKEELSCVAFDVQM